MKINRIQHFFVGLLSIIIILCFGFTNIKAQQIQIEPSYIQGIKYSQDWDLFKGGTELSTKYIFTKSDYNYSCGFDFRTIQWGNQLSVSLGMGKTIGSKYELAADIQNGLALFHSQKLYVFSGGIKFNYLFLQKEKLIVGFSMEGRYTNCPAYKAYSSIYKLAEIPLGVFIRF